LSRTGAVATAAFGVAILCIMDGVIKHLVADNSALVVTAGRYFFATLFAGAIWLRAGQPKLTAEMWRIHGLRGVVIAISGFTFFWALKVLPLAEAITLSFIAPLLIPFFAAALLKEKVRPRNLLAGAAGFIGVLVASLGAPAQASRGDHLLGIAAILCAAIMYALSITLLRGRAGKDGAETVGLFAALIPGVITVVPAIALGAPPAAGALPWFVLMGLLGAAGMYFLARAYAATEAQFLAPLEYTALIWAALVGLVFFNETPRIEVWIGAAIIIAACLWGARETAT
jgi:S-adenosylmethionine uptake transporter